MKATLTTLTPVHIGNGNTYNKNIDFFQVEENIGIIDEAKVLQFIGLENIHQWTAAIERGGEAFSELLKQRGWKGDLQSICSRIMLLRNLKHSSSQLKEVFRTPLKGLCIPGSSLKGALRTAIFNSFLDENECSKITTYDLKNKFTKKWKDDNIIKRFFGNNANENSMRFLKIGDIHLEQTQAEVHELKVLNKCNNNWNFKNGQQTLIEAIPAGVQAEFDFIIDKVLLEKNIEYDRKEKVKFEANPYNFGKNYPLKWPEQKIKFFKHLLKENPLKENPLEQFCKKINYFSQQLVGAEFNKFYDENDYIKDTAFIKKYDQINNTFEGLQSNEFILRIGGNSGYIFTTGQWVDNEGMNWDEDDYRALRKTIQKRDYSDMDFWPKTRKISSSGQLFGFVKISLFDDKKK